MGPGGGGNIKVVVRVRPFNSRGELRTVTNTRASHGLEADQGFLPSKQKSTAAQNVLSR